MRLRAMDYVLLLGVVAAAYTAVRAALDELFVVSLMAALMALVIFGVFALSRFLHR